MSKTVPGPVCDLCGDDDRMRLRALCHLQAPLAVTFEDGMLVLSCYVPDCGREIARFKLAPEELDPTRRLKENT